MDPLDNQTHAPFNRFKPVWIWHPEVHRHYEEQLCYFLLAVKPYVHETFVRQLRELLEEFGIPEAGICRYSLFGTFDLLLRVWLPPGQRTFFNERISKTISNCLQRASFEVEQVFKPWGFPALQEYKEITLRHDLDEVVRRVQEGRATPNEIMELQNDGVLTDGSNLEQFSDAKKAFVFIGAEASLSGTARGDKFIKDIEKCLADKSIASSALYSGAGSAWLLVKLVVSDFYAIGRFVTSLHKNYSHESLTTSTFVVCEDSNQWQQGDAVSSTSMVVRRGRNKTVAVLLPELYEQKFARTFITKVEELILRVLADAEAGSLLNEEKQQILDFLKGVITGSRARVFAVLFPIFGETEDEIRTPLSQSAIRVLGSAGVKILSQKLDEHFKKKGESLNKRSFGDVILGWKILAEAQQLQNPICNLDKEIKDLEAFPIQDIVSIRNRVMHYTDFREEEALLWCEQLFNLFALKKKLRRIIYLLNPSNAASGVLETKEEEVEVTDDN